MRVLVTGASGVFGRSICTRLVRMGADVVALARRDVELPKVVAHRGDIRDAEVVRRAARDCDRIVHLAWTVSPLHSVAETREVDVGGTANVLRAMQDEGCELLVFASSITAYGAWPDNPPLMTEGMPLRPDPKVLYAAHKAEAEQLIAEACVPAVVSRSVVVVGRTLDNYEFRFLASPVLAAPSGPSLRWQLAHEEDIGRFHARAALGDWRGTVNVGPAGEGLTIERMAEVLGKRLIRLPMRVMKAAVVAGWRRGVVEIDPDTLEAFQFMPTVNTSKVRDEWGFEFAYDSEGALADMVGPLSRTIYLGTKRIDKPWRLGPAPSRFVPPSPARDDGLIDPAPPGLRGEFDGYIDPKWPTWSAANVSEAFPGVMTPLSLAVALDALGCSGISFVDFFGMLEPDVALAQRRFPIAPFGHRIYTNVSVVHAMAEAMPGTDPAEIDEQFLGKRGEPTSREPFSFAQAATMFRLVAGIGPRVAGLRAELRRVEARAETVPTARVDLSMLSDVGLQALIERLHDDVVEAWHVSTTINMVASGVQGTLKRLAPDAHPGDFLGGTDALVSARLAVGVQRIATMVRGNGKLAAYLREVPGTEALGRLDQFDSRVADEFQALLASCAHRGPGETELANPMYGDRPDLLLDAVTKALDVPERPAPRRAAPPNLASRRVAAMAQTWLRRRERARDAVVLTTHGLRLAARELGRRAAGRGIVGAPDDVFYLAYDELFEPELASSMVSRRRDERVRLQALALPTSFTLHWEPLLPSGAGGSLTGLGVSPGSATGVARVVLHEGEAQNLQPGEVLIAHVTDVGWTPLFDAASAVITDIGGVLSHAAIVARELGIPCVVGTERATSELRNGQLVTVDGTKGTVTVVG